MFFIFHFSFSAESKKKLFYSPWKFGREKVEKYTLFSCFFTFSGRKMLKSILFGRFWAIFKKVFCFLFFIFHFSFSPNSKKKLFQIFFKKSFFRTFFSPRLFNRPFREKKQKLFFKRAVVLATKGQLLMLNGNGNRLALLRSAF